MPVRLSAATAVTAVALAAAAFGGAYAVGHGDPAPETSPQQPASIALDAEPLAELGRARPLPDLAQRPAPEPPPEPDPDAEPDTGLDSDAPAAVTPSAPVTPAPTPAPASTPAPEPDPAPPANFDDSG